MGCQQPLPNGARAKRNSLAAHRTWLQRRTPGKPRGSTRGRVASHVPGGVTGPPLVLDQVLLLARRLRPRLCASGPCQRRPGPRRTRGTPGPSRAARRGRRVRLRRPHEVAGHDPRGGAGLRGRNLVQPPCRWGPASSPTSLASPVLPGAVRRSTSSAFSVTSSRSKWRSAAKLPAARISGAPSGGESIRFPRTTPSSLREHRAPSIQTATGPARRSTGRSGRRSRARGDPPAQPPRPEPAARPA
jgi:hypothetical protein